MEHSTPYPTFEEVIAKERLASRKTRLKIIFLSSHVIIFLIGVVMGRAFNLS